MTEDCCKHEPDINNMIQDINDMKIAVELTKDSADKTYKAIMGNGKIGLNDRVLIIEQYQTNMPSPKILMFYSSIGGALVLMGKLLIDYL